MTHKKRILLDNEASWLSTGYATYGRALMAGLHATGEYELCELGSYSKTSEYNGRNFPWLCVGNVPEDHEERALAEFRANNFHQFGAYRFEETVLRFKPDYVINIRDDWMYSHNIMSPFRQFYNLLLMPTVDSSPQDEPWIANIIEADAVLTYNDWSLDLLRQQCGGLAKLMRSAPPGIDPELTPTQGKQAHKRAINMPEDSFIVGTVMRNQKRKLFPGLIESFRGFLDAAPKAIADKSYLYLHTTYPDMGWDIPRLLKESGVASRTIMTYKCRGCGHAFHSIFQDARNICPKCGNYSALVVSTHDGVPRATLNAIINCFDVYVQYANAEGFGIPLLEAASCGVPVFAVDYSAMSDVARKLKGTLLKVKDFVREPETHRDFAVPDNSDLVEKLVKFSQLPEPMRLKAGFDTRKAAEKHYKAQDMVNTWIEAIENTERGRPQYDVPAHIHHPITQIPNNLTNNEEIIRWGFANVLGRPDMADSYFALRLIRDLNNGGTCTPHDAYFTEMAYVSHTTKPTDFTVEHALNILHNYRLKCNFWEKLRTNG